MRKVKVRLKSTSPYSQSRFHDSEKLSKERPDDYEARTWKERLHVTEDEYVLIPQMAFKRCIEDVARYLSEKIPGKGNATFTKHFLSGTMVIAPMVLPIKKKDVTGEWYFVPADGKRGGSKRVKKRFPVIPEWEGEVEFWLLDDTITEDVFVRHMEEAGNLIGLGRFRPQNGGFYGRFKVVNLDWSDEAA